MNWLAKAAVQKSIGLLPNGEKLNYVMQRRVTKRLPRPFQDFTAHAERAVEHHALVMPRLAEERRAGAHFYEFGTGWDLIVPLTYWALGVERQTLVDIRANARFELVNHAIGVFAHQHDALEERLGVELRRPDTTPVESLATLRDRFGIEYLAPCDARDTPLASGSVDVVTSTYTFEHIPERDIPPILRECSRILREDGLLSATVDLKDHYSYVDDRVGTFNFLRYSPRRWALIDTSLQSLNRLRYPRYVELFEQSDLRLLVDEPERPTAEDLRELDALPLDPMFAGFAPEDLGVRSMRVLAAPSRG